MEYIDAFGPVVVAGSFCSIILLFVEATVGFYVYKRFKSIF